MDSEHGCANREKTKIFSTQSNMNKMNKMTKIPLAMNYQHNGLNRVQNELNI